MTCFEILKNTNGKWNENFLPHTFFEKPENLAEVGFEDHSGDVFLGVTQDTMRKAMRSDGREEFVTMGGVPVGFRDDWHLTMMVGTRSGKGCSVLVSTLLSCGGLEISIDPKGDHASTTARYRDQVLEQNVAVLPG